MMAGLFAQFESPVLLGVSLLMIALIIPGMMTPATSRRWLKNQALTLQEYLVNTITKQLMISLNTPAHKWATMLVGLMIFMVVLNLQGLLPYTFTPTTLLSLNLGLAIPLWLATVILGARYQPTPSLAHLLPEGSPVPLIPALILIETISVLIRPIALGVRITANLTAGHLLIHLISSATFTLLPMMPTVGLLTIAVTSLLTLLELAVALIQAYVFILLLTLYLQENTPSPTPLPQGNA